MEVNAFLKLHVRPLQLNGTSYICQTSPSISLRNAVGECSRGKNTLTFIEKPANHSQDRYGLKACISLKFIFEASGLKMIVYGAGPLRR